VGQEIWRQDSQERQKEMMKLKVYVPDSHRITEREIIYTAYSFNIEDGHLYIYANSKESFHLTLAVYAPGFWSTVENIDEVDKM
jgi:hypothetical protein